MAPQGTCTISVYLTPSGSGIRTGSLLINDDAINSPQTIALAGSGAAASISISASTLAFGNEALNYPSAVQTLTATNNGLSNVNMGSILASGGYSETDTCGGATLTPGETCTITVVFDPVTTGSVPGTITVNDDATGAPHIVTLTGTGQLPVTFSANLTFPAVSVGSSSAAQTLTMSNNLNQTLSFSYSTSGNFSAVGNGTTPCNGTLAAKAKCTFAVTFTPTSNGTIKGTLTVSFGSAGSPASAGLTGTGQNGAASPLTFSPVNLGFGNVALNNAISKTVTMKNASAVAITFTSITSSGYFVAAPSGTTPCSGTLSAGKTCTMTITFTPQVTGTSVGGITVMDNGLVSTQVFDVTGNGILPVTMSPTTLSFGTVSVGSTSSAQIITVTNNQSVATAINSLVASGDFISTSGGSAPCGASIAANGSCTLGVEFSPTASGAISGNLTLNYGAASSPQVASLSGTGQ